MINLLLIIGGAMALLGKGAAGNGNGWLEPAAREPYFESEPFESYKFTNGNGGSDLDKFVKEEAKGIQSPFTVGMPTGYEAAAMIYGRPIPATATPAIPFTGEAITPYQLTSAYKAYQAVTPPGAPVGFLGYIPASTLAAAGRAATIAAYTGPSYVPQPAPQLPAQQLAQLSPAQLAYARILGVSK